MNTTIARVCIITDKTYLDMSKMCVNEIVRNRDPYTRLFLYVLGNKADVSFFNKYNELPNVTMETYSEDFDRKYGFYNNYRHLTSTVYVRTLLPVLPIFSKLDKILYLDTDIIARKDLAGFYNENIRGKAMGVVKDFGLANVYNSKPTNLKTFCYFNTGQLLMNLAYLRTIEFTERCFKLMHKPGMTDDQPIINTVLKGRVRFLDPIYFFPWHKTVTTGGKYLDIKLWNKTYGTHYKSMEELTDKSVLWHFHGNKEGQRKNPVFKKIFDDALDRANEFLEEK